MPFKTQKAFTLVELLVVISIIGLLLAILMPALNKVRQIGKRTVCKANLHSVAQAFRMYLDDNRLIMPPACGFPELPWNPDSPDQRASGKVSIARYLGSYLSAAPAELNKTKTAIKVLCCPADLKNGDPKHYFKTQESSYDYAERRGGRSMNKASFTKHSPERDVEIMWDYESWHGKTRTRTTGERETTIADLGAVNYLYSDCHVGNRNGD
ncbi:MAG: hypothetical protein A2Y07_11890 [Planctomycetes bacterium GWF2_50_10]|nr:MAG: hypothetical protein A2Y07_11890 [Planctomycetes bacterium GWF2_50_10]